MNELSLRTETSLRVGQVERFLLKVKPGNSPGIAIKSNLWPDLGQAHDQAEVSAPALIETVKKLLDAINEVAKLGTRCRSSIHRGTQVRQVWFRTNPRRSYTRQRAELDSSQMRSRLVCAGEIALTSTMRALFSPYRRRDACSQHSLSWRDLNPVHSNHKTWMPCIVISCHYLPVSGLGNFRACCLQVDQPPKNGFAFLMLNRVGEVVQPLDFWGWQGINGVTWGPCKLYIIP